jgi:putative endopeptidase
MGRIRLVVLGAILLLFPSAMVSQSQSAPGAAPNGDAALAGSTDAPPPVSAPSVVNCSNFSANGRGGADDEIHGVNPADLDRSVNPCDDFYRFANGGWVKNNPVPAAYPTWATFNKLHDENEQALRVILDAASTNPSANRDPDWRKIGEYYGSCVDEKQVESAGLAPIEPELARIRAIHDAAGLQVEIAALQRIGVGAGFRFGAEQDYKDSAKVIASAGQGGLGMPDRQYYLKDDEKSQKLRDGYVAHVTKMFELMGDDDTKAAAEAKTVLDLETRLAKASMERVALRDPNNRYHKMDLARVRELTPHLGWEEYLKETGAPAVNEINIGQPDFFKELDSAIASIPLDDWKVYLRWHLVHARAAALPAKFVNENFSFYGKALTGTEEMLPRWRRCVQATDRALGEALGRYYVEKNFPPAAKAKAQEMVKNLIAALRDDLQTLDWMSPETRKKAIEKLDAIRPKIGYPDKWRDYSAMHVGRVPYAENENHAEAFAFAREMAKIGKPTDREEWGMTPPTVNAYYRSNNNEIVFPAGILQPPFYDPLRDDAMNYGGIGAVIGHELTHGFDDQGSKFDPAGNLVNWWTAEDLKNFQERGDCIAKQFDGYFVEPGLHENGKLVEGESIADLGGATIALAAFHKSLEGKPEPAPTGGFTPDQRFFLAFAHVWANNSRPEFKRLLVATNPHPLGDFRANGPLSNMPSFAKAWGCSANSPMVRPEGERCRIW